MCISEIYMYFCSGGGYDVYMCGGCCIILYCRYFDVSVFMVFNCKI